MNERDRQLIEKRKNELSKQVKDELSLPKGKRNTNFIESSQKKIARMKAWLDDKPKKEKEVVPEKKRITKQEFVEGFKQEFNVQESDQVMVIASVKMLRQVWPNIMGQNISIQVPNDMDPIEAGLIKAEARRLHERDRRKARKEGGFR